MSKSLELDVVGSSGASCCPPVVREVLGVPDAERLAVMFKALGDPVRLRLFSAIASHANGEACVCDLPDVGLSQPTVSHHLKKLREAGLVTSERRATWVYYRIDPPALAMLAGVLAAG
ncbi:metalloregulator ArsR/SmtB family transcription factor [Embleya sp. NPDC005575]|uniref:ArsR/SmtB family transcription factor n=1 Tax=Embleya sp. NPDC005575 TaxID=3156892 RepID=UPI0033A89BDF